MRQWVSWNFSFDVINVVTSVSVWAVSALTRQLSEQTNAWLIKFDTLSITRTINELESFLKDKQLTPISYTVQLSSDWSLRT